jgi:hypothetical protein
MKKVEDYRQHAQECRLLGSRARSPDESAMLMDMADTWESLAADRAAQIARQQRLAEPARGSIPIDKLNASNDD